jgi:hypothetical protein
MVLNKENQTTSLIQFVNRELAAHRMRLGRVERGRDMQYEELQRRLQASEAKRARQVVELHQAQLALETAEATVRALRERQQLDGGNLTTPGSVVAPPTDREVDLLRRIAVVEERLERSERARAQLLREQTELQAQHEGGGAAAGSGPAIIAAVSDSDVDFGADEEDDAREHARQVMSELVRAMHGQKRAQEDLSAAALRLAETQSALDRAAERETELLAMLSQYQWHFAAAGIAASFSATAAARGARSTSSNSSTIGGGASPLAGDALGVSLQAARVKLLEARVKELTEELWQAKMQQGAAPGGAIGARPSTMLLAAGGHHHDHGSTKAASVEQDARLVAKMFTLDQENRDLRNRLTDQGRTLARVQQALVDLGFAGVLR